MKAVACIILLSGCAPRALTNEQQILVQQCPAVQTALLATAFDLEKRDAFFNAPEGTIDPCAVAADIIRQKSAQPP